MPARPHHVTETHERERERERERVGGSTVQRAAERTGTGTHTAGAGMVTQAPKFIEKQTNIWQ